MLVWHKSLLTAEQHVVFVYVLYIVVIIYLHCSLKTKKGGKEDN